MKKFLALLLAFVLMFSSFGFTLTASAEDVNTITAVGAAGFPGDTVEFKILMDNPLGFGAMTLNIEYDDEVLEPIVELDPDGFPIYVTDYNYEMMTTSLEESTAINPIIFTCVGSRNVKGNGAVMVLTFKIKDTAVGGTSTTINVVPEEGSQMYYIGRTETEFYLAPTSAEIEISDMPEQTVTVPERFEKTYGSASFTIPVTKVAASKANPMFTSNNEDVVTVDAKGKVTIVGAGETTVTVDIEGDATYKDFSQDVEIIIAPKPVTVNVNAQEKVYDGTTDAVIDVASATVSGIVTADNGKVEVVNVSAEGVFASKNAANGIAVTVEDAELDGPAKDNYVIDRIVAKGNILKKDATVTADNKESKIGTAQQELTATPDGLVDGDYIVPQLKVTLGTTAKGYPITVTAVKVFNADDVDVTANYNITKVNGVYTLFDKTVQEVEVVPFATSATYGDEPFEIEVNVGDVANAAPVVIASNNPAVATVNGNLVTIVGKGTAKITVTKDGDDDYAPFNEEYTLTVAAKALTVKADDKESMLGAAQEELTASCEGDGLVGDDVLVPEFQLALGNVAKGYTITLKSVKVLDNANDGAADVTANYAITKKNGTYTLLDKYPQSIVIADFPADAVYGGAGFTVSATNTTEQKEDYAVPAGFTYASLNEEVATVDAQTGVVTIVGAGTAKITVTQAGNDYYAAKTEEKELTVAKKELTNLAVNMTEKVVTFDGKVGEDDVTIDFNLVKFTATDVENVFAASNFVLAGTDADNYAVAEGTTVDVTVDAADMATITFGEYTNGTVEGDGTYVKGSSVTVKATANRSYRFDGWFDGTTKVSSAVNYTFTLEADITLTPKFTFVTGGGGGGGVSAPSATVQISVGVTEKLEIKNNKVVKPADPEREGYKFLGWYADKDFTVEFDFDKEVKDSVKIFAAWEKIEEEVKYDPPAEVEWSNPYSDVKADDWYYEAVKFATENKLFTGVTTTDFAPDALLTRAMLVTVLYRMEGEPSVDGAASFKDVDFDTWYGKAVAWANANGIVTGFSADEFAPENNITREQIATIIHRYAKFKGVDVSVGESTNILSYDDVENVSEYAVEAVQYAIGAGLVKGRTETTINPVETATRAEAATIIVRYLSK